MQTTVRSSLEGPLPGLVGSSESLKEVASLARASARTSRPVFLHGPSGTGKDLVARAIHQLSSRREGPFLPVNCGGLPAELVESELFGSTRGAFTGAGQERQGIFRAADGGTVFLDEIGEMPGAAQVKLLRVLQQGAVRPVGGIEELPVDVRLLAATNRPPEESLHSGRLREDLFYRLSVVTIEIPPLSAHPEDLDALCAHFFCILRQRYGGGPCCIPPETLELLKRYAWPGNVRELENVLDRAFALGEAGKPVLPESLPESVQLGCPPGVQPDPGSGCRFGRGNRLLRDCEACLIRAALERADGNRTRAARTLGISRPNLYFRMRKLGIRR